MKIAEYIAQGICLVAYAIAMVGIARGCVNHRGTEAQGKPGNVPDFETDDIYVDWKRFRRPSILQRVRKFWRRK